MREHVYRKLMHYPWGMQLRALPERQMVRSGLEFYAHCELTLGNHSDAQYRWIRRSGRR